MNQIERRVEEPYSQELQFEIARLRNDQSRYVRRFLMTFIVFILILIVLTLIGFFQAPFPVFILISCLLLLGFMKSSDFMTDTWLENSTMTCPHCEAQIVTARIWICGWCSYTNKNELRGLFEGCGHKTCKQKPNAMRCPECGADIVLRESSYNRERGASTKRVAGVAKLLEPHKTYFAQLLILMGSEKTDEDKKNIEDDLDRDIG